MSSPIFDQPLSCFVTGTDTEIGKTLVASALIHLQAKRGVKVAGMKPVAAGAKLEGERWVNEDVESLMLASSVKLDQNLVCPYLYRTPVAPHIASEIEGRSIEPDHIIKSFNKIQGLTESIVVEGVGGFRVPLTKDFDTADLAVKLNLPVILVVGLRLGCISQALLTMEAINSRGLKLLGWVANSVNSDMHKVQENLLAIRERIEAPLLGQVPYLTNASFSQAANYLLR